MELFDIEIKQLAFSVFLRKGLLTHSTSPKSDHPMKPQRQGQKLLLQNAKSL